MLLRLLQIADAMLCCAIILGGAVALLAYAIWLER